jgi:hypothetical protein
MAHAGEDFGERFTAQLRRGVRLVEHDHLVQRSHSIRRNHEGNALNISFSASAGVGSGSAP